LGSGLALVARGHQVTLVCGSFDAGDTGLDGPFRRGQRRGTVDGLQIIELQLPYSNHLSFSERSRAFLRYALRGLVVALREPCDLVFATSPPLSVGVPGLLAKWLRRKPLVFEARDLWPEFPRAMGIIRNRAVLAALDAFERVAYRSADACIGLAPGIVAAMDARRGRARAPAVLIPNGCDLDLFNESADRRQRPQGVDPDDLLAVYVGTHGLANGLDALLDGAAELLRRGRGDIKLMLVGDGKMKPTLLQRARDEGLSNCLFLDRVPKTEVPALLRSANLGLMVVAPVGAFAYATSPNKFFDYLATPLPVLTNHPGWIADLIREHGCGRAVPAGQPQALAEALIDFADHRGQLEPMARCAAQLAREQFDRRRLAHQFACVLEQAAAGR
jgi:glycosyltransferase involved in cell wall biosynthesis